MNDAVVRIQQIELINFKNIEHGTVTFPSYLNVKQNDNGQKKAEIIGVYGQNGSGKTALVDAMWLLEYVLKGKKLPLYIDDFILQGALEAELKFVFSIENWDSRYLVFYDLEIRKDEGTKACVSKENLSYRRFKEDKWGSKISIIEYNRDYKDTIFKIQKAG
jgi:AAA15 family ATPase/GTPase